MPHRTRASITLSLCCLAACLAAAVLIATAVRIELLNIEAGHVLPRPAETRDTGELVKWRLHASPTTSAEVAENQLREVVRTWGLAQYPVALAIVLLALYILYGSAWRHKIPIAVFAVAVMLIAHCAIGLAAHRGYWSSLAW